MELVGCVMDIAESDCITKK